MGLKKPSTGGGLPSDVVDYSGKQATFAASTTDYDGTNIRMHSKPKEKTLLDTASTVTATAPLSSFGDATEADVAAGKTFTGAAGLFKTGTREKYDVGLKLVKSITPNIPETQLGMTLTTNNVVEIVSTSGNKTLKSMFNITSEDIGKGITVGAPYYAMFGQGTCNIIIYSTYLDIGDTISQINVYEWI